MCLFVWVVLEEDPTRDSDSAMQEEVEIRAATVIATERICAVLARAPGVKRKPLAIQVDWMLWQDGEARKDDILPHHRTLTCFY